MAAFSFPQLDLSWYIGDDVGMELYLTDAPHGFVPLSVPGDSNCFYRSASLVATGDEKMIVTHTYAHLS